ADTTVTNGQTYYYVVVARDGAGFESRWSNFNSDCPGGAPDCVDATPLNPNPPAAPSGVTVIDGEVGSRLNVSWLPISDPNNELVRYDVCWGLAAGSYGQCASAAKTTSFVLTGLTNGIPYHVVIRATNTSNMTSQSADQV